MTVAAASIGACGGGLDGDVASAGLLIPDVWRLIEGRATDTAPGRMIEGRAAGVVGFATDGE